MVRNPRKKRLEKNQEFLNKQMQPEKQQPPNMIQKASNLAKASVKHAGSGFKTVSEATKNKRLEICNSCPFKVGTEEKPTCNKCGCFLKIKAGWASESCPIGKWGVGEIPKPQNRRPSGGCGSCGKKKT